MDQILALLYGLGPWGVLAGVVLTIVVQRLKLKFPTLPSTPKTPNVPPVPGPSPTPTDTPIKDALLKLLMDLMAKKAIRENRPIEAVAMDLVGREVASEVVASAEVK